MTGRMENDRKTNNRSKRTLKAYPDIFSQYFGEACARAESSKNDMIGKTLRMYNWLLEKEIIPDASKESWLKVTKRDIKDYLIYLKEERHLSIKTISDEYTAMRKFFSFLVTEGIILITPVPEKREIESIMSGEDNYEKEVVYMTPEEVGIVSDSILKISKNPKMDICLFKLGCRTGLRATALTEIDIDDIDFQNNILYVIEKGRKYRRIILDSDTMRLIRECIEERSELIKTYGEGGDLKALFIKYYNGMRGIHGVRRITRRHIENMIKKNTTMLDKHITPHKMRSTCITNTYILTGDIYAAARKGGHKSLTNTKRYINTTDKDRALSEELADLY